MSLENELAQKIDPSKIWGSFSLPEQQAKDEVQLEQQFWDRKLKEQQIADMASARSQREKYAHRIFCLVCIWVGCIFAIIISQIFCGNARWYHPLSDKVLLTLIGSTTADMLGALVIILRYIFKSEP